MVRRVKVNFRLGLRRCKRFLVHNLLHADDPPHKIALGAALGMFVAFTPTVGFQMVIVVFLAWMFRANKLAGVPIVWITNPVTVVPIYYPCYLLGAFLLGTEILTVDQWPTVEQLSGSWWHKVTTFWNFTLTIFGPLWVGGCVIGLVTGGITYVIAFVGISKYRKTISLKKILDTDISAEFEAAMKEDESEEVKSISKKVQSHSP